MSIFLKTPPLQLGALVLSLLLSASVQADYSWTNVTTGTHNWSTATNWMDSVAPGNPVTQRVVFNWGLTTDYTVKLDGASDLVLQGGLHFVGVLNSAAREIKFDLDSKKMILDGGVLGIERNQAGEHRVASVLFSNGTLQMGTDTNAASIDLGNAPSNSTAVQPNTVKMDAGSTFDSYNLANVLVAANDDNFSHEYTLDLSQATLRSGAESGALKISGTLGIGHISITTTNGNGKKLGVVRLGVLSSLSVGRDLTIGQNNENRNVNVASSGSGSLIFSSAQSGPVTVTVGNDLRLGVGDFTRGTVESMPDEVHLTVGKADTAAVDRGVIYVGYKPRAQASGTATVSAVGSWVSEGGSLNAYVRELRVGQNVDSWGTVSGTFDFSKAELGVLSVSGSAVIGKGLYAAGTLLLKGGEASSQSLVIGEATGTLEGGDPTRSLLGLDNTVWSVSNSVTIGAFGNLEITLGNTSSGIDIAGGLTLADGGKITVWFNEEAGDEGLWGLRWAGDNRSVLEGWLGTKLLGEGTFASGADLFYDGTHTYYGFAPIPEPATGLMGLGGLMAVVGMLRRRMKE